jgi:hypothetical protein
VIAIEDGVAVATVVHPEECLQISSSVCCVVMADGEWDPDDVLLVIEHPWGTYEKTLTSWMTDGPGPRNGRPVSIRSRSSGETLPLTVIPLAYRNDRQSRALVAAGKIEPPWRVPWNLESWGAQPCEIGGPRVFGRSVADVQRVDRLVVNVLSEVLPGTGDAEAARLVLARVPEFSDEAPVMVRRLAAEARWNEFDTIIALAGAAGLVNIAPVLCEILESDARPPRPGHIVDVLGWLRFDDAAQLLERLVGRFIYADESFSDARRCLRVLAAMGANSRAVLTLMSWRDDWPDPIQRWAIEELEAAGERTPPSGS